MSVESSSGWSPSPDLERRAMRLAALGDPARLAMVEELLLSDRSPSELGRRFGMASNRLAHHLDLLERAGLVERVASEGDARRRYLRLRPERVEGLVRRPSIEADDLLFVCRRNSARSQYAAAFWPRASSVPASSAGADPAPRVHPLAVEAAARRGIDLRPMRPRGYDEVAADRAAAGGASVAASPGLLVSVCDIALEDEPPFSPARRLHWSVPDPAPSGDLRAFEAAFDLIEARVSLLAASLRAA